MKLCSHCGTQNQPDARFCASCGLVFTDEPPAPVAPAAFGAAPPGDVPVFAAPPKRPMNNALVVALLVLLALASAGVTLLLTRSDGKQAAAAPTSSASTIVGSTRSFPDTIPTTTTTEPTSSAEVTTTGLPTTTAAVTVPADVSTTATVVDTVAATTTLAPTTTVFVPPDPQTVLNDQLDNDRGIVEGLVGFWVPQLSSKAEGTVADGITYTLSDIVAKDQELRAEFGTVLLFSGEYNYKVSGLYVDIVPQGFGDPDSALGFCTDHGIDRDNCFAKFITHDMSLTSTTKLQP